VAAALTLLLPAAAGAQEVIINEILANNVSTAPLAEIIDYFPEYIELYNSSLRDIDLGAEGWTISDNPGITNKFQFQPGTMIYADSFLLLFCDDETNFPGIHVGFSLDATTGETISIYKRFGADYALVTTTKFGIQLPGYSVGRLPGANESSGFTLNYPTPCGGTVPCLANTLAPFVPPPTTSNQFTLKINEWLATNSAGADEDWLEIYNPDTNIVSLADLVFWDKPGSRFATPENNGPRPVPALSYIGPLGYVRFFCSGDVRPAANNLNFGISSGTELRFPPENGILDTNYLYSADRNTIVDVVLCKLFRRRNVAEGRVPDGSSRIVELPNPTPGEANFGPIPEININELLSHTDLPLEDAVEFQNVSSNAVDMSYWWMSNQRNTPKKYRFPPGSIVQPGAFHVVYEKDFGNTNTPGNIPFTFNSANGDECYIFKADATGELLGYRKGVSFGAAPNGVSFGRIVTSDGNPEFVLMCDLSFGTQVRAGMSPGLLGLFRTGRGETNSPACIGPVVINEIHYHPQGANGVNDTNDNSFDEFIELRNVSSSRVNLYYEARAGENPDFLTNRWKIRGNVDYEFPKTSFPFMAPNSYLLVVNFDPTTNATVTDVWRSTKQVADGTKMFGPYKGKLSNREGNVELYRPDTPQTFPHPDAGLTPQILVDRVHYEDRPPWPSNSVDGTVWADGGRGSLQRRFSYEYANDPTNWFVDLPTPGSYNSKGPLHLELPYFVISPLDYIDVAPRTNLVLYAQARGDLPITYQWYRNGAPIPMPLGIRADLPINNVGAANIGQYYVVARNPAGSSTSRVATISVACPYLLSRVGTAFGQPGGEGSVTVQAPGGCPWEVVGIPSWVTVTSGTSFDGTDTFSYSVGPYNGTTVRVAILNVAGQSYRISQSPPDNTRPTVAFTAPASGARITTPVALIRGTASDNYDVQRVEVQTGSSAYVPALGTRAWTNFSTLQPGTNWIRVRSVDLSGNISVTNIRSIVYVVTSPLNLVTNTFGWGTVSGATNLQRLELGRGYTLTATARPGYAFSNWTGDILTTSAAKLQFLMQPNMSIAANFVLNPFIPAKGTYIGLFTPNGFAFHTNSGSFKITTTDKGTYSASILLGGKKYAASGQLDLDGSATNVIQRAGLAPLTVQWSFNLNSALYVYGSIGATNWENGSAIFGERSVAYTRSNAPLAGKYTLIVPGDLGNPNGIQGDGYGTATIDFSGNLKFSGVLADGAKVTQSVPITKSGLWPHHAVTYGGRGSIQGWVAFDANGVDISFQTLLPLSWNRPGLPATKLYTNLLTFEPQMTGSIYRAPVGATSRILNLTNAQVVLTGGSLTTSPSINDVVLGLSSRVTNASPNTLTCTFTLPTGLFTGTYRETGTTRTITFRGAVLQVEYQNRGSGHFLSTNESGHVAFEARPTQ
jgi:hypothetical protein